MKEIPQSLIDRIRASDERAFRCLVDACSDDLLYYACCLLQQTETAEEVVSDVLLEVWKHRKTLHEIKDLRAWMVTLTHNRAVSCLRKEAPAGRAVSLDDSESFQFASPLQPPDEAVISREALQRINEIIRSLPPKCRQAFVLAKIEGLSYKEIARIMDISVKTINIHIAKALQLIAAAWKGGE